MERLIHSIWAEDNENTDGYYLVEIPEGHERTYYDDIQKAYKDVEKELEENNEDDWSDLGGCTLSVVLEKLGWKYKDFEVDVYDLDYNNWY